MNAIAVSVRDAADLVGISQDKIREAINKRHLPAKLIGRAIRVEVDDLREWFRNLPDASPAEVE